MWRPNRPKAMDDDIWPSASSNHNGRFVNPLGREAIPNAVAFKSSRRCDIGDVDGHSVYGRATCGRLAPRQPAAGYRETLLWTWVVRLPGTWLVLPLGTSPRSGPHHRRG